MTTHRDSTKAHVKLIAASIFWLAASFPAYAGGLDTSPAPFEPIDVQAIIDGCWDGVDLADQTKSFAVRRQEVIRVDECYFSQILRLIEPMFDPDLFSKQDARRLLIEMSGPTVDFYAYLFAGHRKCGCGPDAELRFFLAVIERYEAILRGIADVRDMYKR
jgi:hypothetical protein